MVGSNKSGGGASTNKHGKAFEKKSSIKNLLLSNGYEIIKTVVKKKNKEYGILSEQSKFYPDILGITRDTAFKEFGTYLLPDAAFFNYDNQTLYIMEVKYQNDDGSVDEKIQTCEYKLRFYNRLVWEYKKDMIKHVRYFYVLSDHFKDEKYLEMLHFIQDKGCDYYFDKVGLSSLGL